jgi:hypothetical protein
MGANMLKSKRTLIALLAALPVVVIGALAAFGGTSARPPVAGAEAARFPAETFTDWVSYGDHVAIFSVTAEEEITPPPDVYEQGGGYIGRAVTLRIEKMLWTRKGASSLGSAVRVLTYGWVYENGERHPAAAWGSPRLQVGGRYVAPFVKAPRDGVDWTALSAEATLPLVDGVITTDGIVGGSPSAIARRMRASSPDELARILAGTAPDALAVKYAQLSPDARVEAVMAERAR